MARKYDLITELYEDAIHDVTSKPENWIAFLKSACRNYRLPFDEQLLVYVQRPDATAVLEMHRWNKKFGRWVKKGSKGIAVFDKSSRNMQLKFFYDISDTVESRFRKWVRPVPLWEVKKDYQEAVKETLANTFGVGNEVSELAEVILSAAHNATEDNVIDYIGDILNYRKDSYLEEIDDYNVEVEVKKILSNSISYMVMTRCGIDPEIYLDREDFRNITDFNTPELVNLIGTVTSDVAEMALVPIADTIRKLQKPKRRKRTFARENHSNYNDVTKKNKEGRSEDERSNIYQAGELSDSKSDRYQRRTSSYWEVWVPSQEIFEGKSLRDFHQSVDAGETQSASSGNTERSTGEDGILSERDGKETERDGGTESERPDVVAGNDEQHQTVSRGNRDDGTDIQLEWYDRRNEDKSLPFLHQSSIIKPLLLQSPALLVDKKEIADYFEKHEDGNAQTEFIKKCFGNEITDFALDDGRMVGHKTFQNVLQMWEGTYSNRTSQVYYSWSGIADYFNGMRMMGELKDIEEGQMSFTDEWAEEKRTSAFSIPQEVIDYDLRGGSGFQYGKFRIYSFYMQGHTLKEKENFLKQEYGTGGHSPVIVGTGIGQDHDAKGIKYHIGYGENATKVLVKWNQVAKRIGELIECGRYMSAKELEWLPEYEKYMLSRGIYNFYYRQPEGVVRPYPPATDYDKSIKIIRPQLDDSVRVEEILESMSQILTNTADFDRFYESMQKAYKDLQDYKDGVYSLFSPIRIDKDRIVESSVPIVKKAEERIAEKLVDFYKEYDHYGYLDNLKASASDEEVIQALTKQIENPESIGDIVVFLKNALAELDVEDEWYSEIEELLDEIEQLPAMNLPYDLSLGTTVYLGMDEYDIETLGEDIVILRDNNYPLFTKEIPREEFERKLRENPANDHLKVKHNSKDIVQEVIEPVSEEITEVIADDVPLEKIEPDETETVSDMVPEWEKEKSVKKTESIYPHIPAEQRLQYQIQDAQLEYGTPKEKFRANMAAIEVLKQCEEDGRYATADEQGILSRYVGWGGLSEAFDESITSWGKEYMELKRTLTDEEFQQARESTLTAFYTPPVVIRAMYQALENMGLKTGNILEPSCGIGNFIGMKPESLADSKIFGVELDSISGRIAGQLYQKSSIAVQGYEESNLPDSFFDVAIGNVPFGQFKVSDKKYDKYNFLIHDFFFAKTLDKVRPGGVIAFITTSGTMDKTNPSIRKYIAQRAELIGAIRLPNNTFTKNAGTKVTSDILFLQKRDRMIETEPEWLYLDKDENGITMNNYFIQHPEMILGEMVMESTQYGMSSTCRAYEEQSLEELLSVAIDNIHAEISEYEVEEMVEEEDRSIPADPRVANYSYTIFDGQIYYRENSRMKPVEVSVTAENRIKGMIAIRDCVRELIHYQTEGYSDKVITEQQDKLNQLYERFTENYGLLNSRANSSIFSDDNSYPLLSSLEILAEDGTLERKADMFTKRTIKPHLAVSKVDTASEALSLSLSERACVDMEYMCEVTGKDADEIEEELKGVIFRIPASKGEEVHYVSEDEYLSGNVREKLKQARIALQSSDIYRINVEALEKVQPKDLSASEISVRLGATWIPSRDIEDFMFDLLDTPYYHKFKIKVNYSKVTGEWNIEGKSLDKGNFKVSNTYGTSRVSAYKIIEDSLNLRDTRIYDYIDTEDGKKKAILNKKETAIAQEKQDLIKQAFQDWIWDNPNRRQRLTTYYNEKFNALRPREYDGSHLNFYGMNPEIQLRQHQKNGVARIIYGGNTLLAYVVGAGKTYTMVAAAMESKRLGLCNKSMIVVPNHIIEQFAAEWLQLYPAANLLVATKKDFETKNRKKFCARIATSDIDAVIIGHSQFEKIPMSIERQRAMLEEQIAETLEGIREEKRRKGSKFTIKQLEKSRKSLETKLKKLNDQTRKDDVVCFEELGIDRLFVDEADSYKNLYLQTKMRNVGGIAQTEAQKSSDMFMKCRYLDEITGGKGVIFATGTPVSNSMVELYTMQRYLQYGTLRANNLQHFDAWASTFGETVTAIELAPEGTGYRLKTRFAKFFNLPELMMMFREVADIQTADMLNLPVPEAEYRVVTVKPSKMQKDMVLELGKRAEKIRAGIVNAVEDNMLLITNDGRKLALDQRLINELLPDEPESKVNACVEETFKFWEDGKDKKLTQLLFCDLSTPKTDGTFSVYNDVRDKLTAKGIPKEEVAFIHDANTEVRKKELFSKVRRGAVRILMGSTFKMGAGTNVQDLIIASHDLDCPWRPRDLEQRAGRTIRQGNKNKKVDIIRYVTEGTFDAYLYQVIENKQKFISQIMTSKSPARTVDDIDEVALSYAEIKAFATGNPYIKEKMDLDIQVSKLQLLKQSFLSQKYEVEDKVTRYFPKEIKQHIQWIEDYKADIAHVKEHTPENRDTFPVMQIHGVVYGEKKEAGKAIIEACKSMRSPEPVPLGSYRGLGMELSYRMLSKEFVITLKGKRKYEVALGTDIHGNIIRIDNEIDKISESLERCTERLENLKMQLENAKEEAKKEFPMEHELTMKTVRLAELNALLDMDKTEHTILDGEDGEEVDIESKNRVRER